MSEPPFAGDPGARASIDEDGRARGLQNLCQPSEPQGRKAPGEEDLMQAIPIDGIKNFGELEFEDQSWLFPAVAALHQLSGIHEVLRDGTATDEPCLIVVY